MKRKIEPIEWHRYQDEDGTRFWWHPDDDPPAKGTLMGPDTDDWSATTMLRVRLDPPIKLYSCTFDELSVVWSERQCCNFLLAHGVDERNNYEEMRVSVNLLPYHSTAHGYFYCRDEDFNEEFVRELTRREILKPTGQAAASGFITIPLFRFTPIEKAHELTNH